MTAIALLPPNRWLDRLRSIQIGIAALVGKTSGSGTSTLYFRDTADSKDRITVSVDGNNNRTGITLDLA